MSDVRLTATNPADSSVVPVACNAKGELKLEEPIAFDGNLDGDLDVTGSFSLGSAFTSLNDEGNVYINVSGKAVSAYDSVANGAVEKLSISKNGTGNFKGVLYVDTSDSSKYGVSAVNSTTPNSLGTIHAKNNGAAGSPCYQAANTANNVVARINNDGSCVFAGNKAGFTADGYLWCTTRRGDTVVLDATANGLGTWADYTPPTRRESINRLPQVSQDLPETEADTP